MRSPIQLLRAVRLRWQVLLLTKYLLMSALVSIGSFFTFGWTLALGGFCAVFLLLVLIRRPSFPSESDVTRLLDAQVPELEYSVGLVTTETSGLAALQQRRVAQQLSAQRQSLQFPIGWQSLGWALGLGLLLFAGGRFLDTKDPTSQPVETHTTPPETPGTAEHVPLQLVGIQSTIYPPAYTGLSRQQTSDPNLRIIEGSTLQIAASFSGTPRGVALTIPGASDRQMSIDNTTAQLQMRGPLSAFYFLRYNDGTDTLQSPYYQIEVIADTPPSIQVEGLLPYEKVPYSPEAGVSFTTQIMDDYGIEEVFLTATITKGSGESVKFREQRLDFSQAPTGGRRYEGSMTLEAKDFDMEPGNELYFFITARDNKAPESQTSRTETFFFVLEDTAEVAFSLQGTLGVDLMPEYFRSQRQIIIDTERLIEERSQVTRQAFNSTSNELGFDQKALRIRYGQFLGEEDESGIAIETAPEDMAEDDHKGHDHSEEENVVTQFGHNHDHEEEEGQLLDKGTYAKTAEEIVEEIAHSHDDAETAAFYTISMKTMLRAALTEMWDAELYLRLFQPEKSLPYQYAALKLLKEIKNQARIYVQRIGFEPPPIQVSEHRLQGDLENVESQKWASTTVEKETYPAITKAARIMSELLPLDTAKPNTIATELQSAGNELTAVALEAPGEYLETLSAISRLMRREVFAPEDEPAIALVIQSFLALLDQQEKEVANGTLGDHPLLRAFREEFTRGQTTMD